MSAYCHQWDRKWRLGFLIAAVTQMWRMNEFSEGQSLEAEKQEAKKTYCQRLGDRGTSKERHQSSSHSLTDMETVGNTFQSRIPSHIINCLFQLLYSSCLISKRHFQIADMHIHPRGDITLLSLTDWLRGPRWHSVLICWLGWCLQAHKGSRWGVLGSPVYCGTIIRFSAASALGLQCRHTSWNFRGLPSTFTSLCPHVLNGADPS